MKNYKIAVAGTGYVGLSIATLLSQHHKVTAVDIVPEKVEMINNRKSPIQDDYIEKYLAEKDLNLTATLDAKAAYSDADFVVIAAPTNYDSQTQHFDTSAVTPNATNGEKIKALRTAQGMSMAELSRRASMSDRAIRYIEAGEREPSVDAIQKIAAALGVTTDYFMDDATFQKELSDDQFYADVRKKYGSRGVAQAKKIKEQTSALLLAASCPKKIRLISLRKWKPSSLTQKKRQKSLLLKNICNRLAEERSRCWTTLLLLPPTL